MGVSKLWEVLSDASISKCKQDINEDVVAVDLATWICEAEGVKMMHNTVFKPYFRNLLFRVKSLICSGIKLVFVADGTPPELKRNTIKKRLGFSNETSHSAVSMKRRGLNFKLQECCNLLEMLGIPWVKAEGEAEATCAALNMDGYVDACATSDGDVLLYGATKIYRNLNTKKDSFECFEMSYIREKLKLNRDDLISLGLLLGCDYTDGVPGIGKVSALSWLKSSAVNENSLERLRKLRSQEPGLNAKTGGCVCGESFRKSESTSKPCACAFHVMKTKSKASEVQNKLIKYAKMHDEFPNESVIAEFRKKRSLSGLDLSRRSPKLRAACELIESTLKWKDRANTVKMLLPLLTHWILNKDSKENTQIIPTRITKSCIRNGVPMYEVEWKLLGMPGLHDQLSTEPRELVRKTFPDLVSQFEAKQLEDKEKKKAEKKAKKTKTTDSKISDYFAKEKTRRRKKESESPHSSDRLLSSLSRLSISGSIDEKPQGTVISSSLCPLFENSVQSCAIKSNREKDEIDSRRSSSVIIVEDWSVSEFSRDMFDYDSDVCDYDQSISEKENRHFSENSFAGSVEPASPVYMSLAERIRLKK